MTMNTDTAMPALLLGEAGSDPIEDRLRETVRATIEALFDEELAAYLGRIRYGRGDGARKGCRQARDVHPRRIGVRLVDDAPGQAGDQGGLSLTSILDPPS